MTVLEAHPVLEGRVFCARLGRDADLERCLRCPRLADFELDTTHPYVRCERPPADPEPRSAAI